MIFFPSDDRAWNGSPRHRFVPRGTELRYIYGHGVALETETIETYRF
jgi:hypothetical protein